jgi:hypothetical protein
MKVLFKYTRNPLESQGFYKKVSNTGNACADRRAGKEMTMEERIKTELAKLAQQKEQALAQLNAILGAEQALQQLLEPEKKEEAAAE